MSLLRPHGSGTALEYRGGFSRLTRRRAMTFRKSLALVVEDTELGRWALKRALEAEGFEVLACSAWADASVYLHRMEFALALVAVSSISENVTETVAGISKDLPDTHLILLADQDSVGELQSICGPRADILAKPLDVRAVAHVAHACSGRP